MTRRERLEAKAEKRLEWASKAADRSSTAFERADRISERFYGGQPILVGHHSEAGARADQKRIHNAMDRGIEEQKLAAYHAGKASGLAHMLKHDIFSDDDDAIGQLEKRIAAREERAAAMVAANAAWRKAKAGGEQPYESWEMSNLRANIRSDKERVEQIKVRQARAEQAERSATGVTIEESNGWCRVTFAEKPSRDILDALRSAGFMWRGGSWVGERAKLPEGIS